ncbi:hypothetical protein BMS3Abin04_03159 [bacterium BMS3Abin04]|nr:hypothetical protein BMS3Abin04_03159 [bacterium BMS3Abin04]
MFARAKGSFELASITFPLIVKDWAPVVVYKSSNSIIKCFIFILSFKIKKPFEENGINT